VSQHSQLVSYACDYDLCTPDYVFDGTSSGAIDEQIGKSIDFAGPNYVSGPWIFTIDMGSPRTFSKWRVAGNRWYSFGNAHLNVVDASAGMTKVRGSDVTYSTSGCGHGASCPNYFVEANFDTPVTATMWQVEITSHSNSDSQSRFQLYLAEAQFGQCSTSTPALAETVATTMAIEPQEAETIFDTLEIAWGLLRTFPKEMLKRMGEKTLTQYYAWSN
jgi:hypothetical protein